MKVPLTELEDRLNRFRARMDFSCPGWEIAAIAGKIPLHYFTGTIQDGLLLIPQAGEAVFWVRQIFERAQADAKLYARKHGLVFVEGPEVLERWEAEKSRKK